MSLQDTAIGAGNIVDDLNAIVERLGNDATQIDRMSLADAAENYVILKNLDERLDEVAKALGKTVEHIKTKTMPTLFERDKLTSCNTRLGYRVTTSMLTRATMVDKEGGKQWLKDNGLGDIVTETVNSSTLAATAKSLLEDGKELDPLLFNVVLMPTTSVTKIKPKA